MKLLLNFFTLMIVVTLNANAHFLALLPNTDNIQNQEQSTLKINAIFMHPFEQKGLMLKNAKIFLNNKKTPLKLFETKKFNFKSFETTYKVKSPGIYKFFCLSEPYYEKSEEKFISQTAKVIVSAYGIEEGWDKPIGLEYEIIPMVKPFGLYSNNIFTGKVLHNGKPVSNTEVEAELYNTYNLKAPSDSHITQVVKTNANGEFSFVMNHKGWWTFAALIENGKKIHKGKMYPIENGAVLWIKAY